MSPYSSTPEWMHDPCRAWYEQYLAYKAYGVTREAPDAPAACLVYAEDSTVNVLTCSTWSTLPLIGERTRGNAANGRYEYPASSPDPAWSAYPPGRAPR
jgi:hypothetical protein